MRACNNLPQPPKTKDVGRGLRKIVACSHSSSQCLLVSTVFGTVSSLHPTSFLMIFTLVVLYMSLPQYIPNCLLVSTVFGTVSSLHPTSFLMIFTLVPTHFFSHKYGKHTLGSRSRVIYSACVIARTRALQSWRWGRGRTTAHAPYPQNGD